MDEKKALKGFADLMQETSASATIKMNGPGEDKSSKSNAPDNAETRKKIEKNDETDDKSAADTLKMKPTSKKDSESQDVGDSAETLKQIEKNDKTKKFSYPGR